MVVWRIQNHKGIGPYRCDDSFANDEEILAHHNGCKKHPVPFRDPAIKRFPEDEELCAFHSLEQLEAWFTLEEIKTMRKEGFKATRRIGHITATSKYQVLFIPVSTQIYS